MMITINRERNIGRVLFVVEGLKTEFHLLHRLFTRIFDFQYEKLDRMDKYRKYNAKEKIASSVFVINTEESALQFVDDENEYLNRLFGRLIDDYRFPVDRAAIYYIFDRDVNSNTNRELIRGLLDQLTHARDTNGFSRQGLLLLSYPAIESFVASHFIKDTIELTYETGKDVKSYLEQEKINQSKISEQTLVQAVEEMLKSFAYFGAEEYDLDRFAPTNLSIFDEQEQHHEQHQTYRMLSLLSVVFLDLGIVEIGET
ncbi:MAG TPA: hypothetical protein VFV52_03030 [Bacilli bacterium]|nr:hypothetical protein [Bacilli bacterium]